MKKIIIFCLIISLFSCKSRDNNSTGGSIISGTLNNTGSNIVGSWYRLPEGNVFNHRDRPVNIPIIPLQKDKVEEAILLLQNISYKLLTNDEYKHFGGGVDQFIGRIEENEITAYLIRSLSVHPDGRGSYNIFKNEKNDLHIINYNYAGRDSKIGYNMPIIILYNDKINEVFVSVSAAE